LQAPALTRKSLLDRVHSSISKMDQDLFDNSSTIGEYETLEHNIKNETPLYPGVDENTVGVLFDRVEKKYKNYKGQ
jgi:hypothetical protein